MQKPYETNTEESNRSHAQVNGGHANVDRLSNNVLGRLKPFGKILKKVAWNVQKALFDSRPTVAWPPTTVAWPFSDFFSKTFMIAWNVQKTLFDSRPTVAWPPTTVAWPFSDLFNILPNCLKRIKNVVWQSADGRVTSDHCRVTVQRLSSKFSQIAWNVRKTLFDSRPTVAWPPTTVAWPFSDIFQNFRKSLETSRKRCLTVGRRSRDLRLLSRDRSVAIRIFFEKSR